MLRVVRIKLLYCIFASSILASPLLGQGQYPTLAGDNVFTGKNSFPSINNVLWVDGSRYSTCADAITAAGSVNKTIIVVPSTYTGEECPTVMNLDGEQETITSSNITIWDFRGGNVGHNLDFNSKAQDANNQIDTKLSVMGYWSVGQDPSDLPSTDTFSAILGTNFLTKATPMKSFAAITGEAALTGPITTIGGGTILSIEGYTAIRSTGLQTLADVRGGTFSVNIDRPMATTNIGTASSVWAEKCSKNISSSAHITNCYSLNARQPTDGTTRNYAAILNGKSILGFVPNAPANGSGIDAEDSGGVARQFLYIDSNNNTNLQAINANGLFLRDNGGMARATVTTSGVTVTGDLTVTGAKSSVARLSDGRTAALYAIESPENWFEDFGTAQLDKGIARIVLDPTFLQTVNTEMAYQVFLTPNGDCEGLYVAEKTVRGFEVRELHGGKSNTTFDYRIVAKRRGFETLRLQEVPAQRAAGPPQAKQ